jgi:hypothetical protein
LRDIDYPKLFDNRLIDGGEVVSPTVTILDISHRPVFYLKGPFVPHRKHIRSRYQLSIGLFVPHRKHIMSCL